MILQQLFQKLFFGAKFRYYNWPFALKTKSNSFALNLFAFG